VANRIEDRLGTLIKLAASVGVKVHNRLPDEIELEAPEGYQFGPELHFLVTARWDKDSRQTLIKAAIKDLEGYRNDIVPCPEGCPCGKGGQFTN